MDSLLQYWSTTTLLMMILISFVSVYTAKLILRRRMRKIKLAPKATGGWPIIGHLGIFGGSEAPHEALGSMADKYGSAFSMQLGSHKTVVISSSDLVKECFTTNDKVVSYRATPLHIKHMFYNEYSVSSAPYGSYWRDVRKLSTHHLLSNQQVEMFSRIRNSEVNAWFNDLYGLCKKMSMTTTATTTTTNAGVLVELNSWFSDMVFNVLVTMIFGKEKCNGDVLSVDDEEAAAKLAGGDSKFVKKYKKIGDESMRLMATFAVSDVIPWLGWLDHLRGLVKAMKQNGEDMNFILENVISKHRHQHRQNQMNINGNNSSSSMKQMEDEQKEQAFIYQVLSTMEQSDQKTQFIGLDTDTVIKSLCQNLIVGGYDTIAVSSTWVISVLLNNRDVLKKAQEELDAKVGKDRQIEDSDTGKLVYLQAIIKEVMRLYPSGPLLERVVTEDCEIGGYHVGAGERVLVNIWKVQRDPNVWSDPLEFRPERFLDDGEEMKKDLRGQDFEFIPFGSGRRICPAVTFSLGFMNLILARLIHNFDIRTPMDAMVDLTGSPSLINKKVTPLQVLLAPRLNSSVYKC